MLVMKFYSRGSLLSYLLHYKPPRLDNNNNNNNSNDVASNDDNKDATDVPSKDNVPLPMTIILKILRGIAGEKITSSLWLFTLK